MSSPTTTSTPSAGRDIEKNRIPTTMGDPPLDKPGEQEEMSPAPVVVPEGYQGSGKLDVSREEILLYSFFVFGGG